MIAHRHGHSLTLCDSCYRPRRTNEPGWRAHPEGVEATTARVQVGGKTPPEPEPIPTRTVEVPAQPVDYCPDCVEAMQR